MSDEIIDGVGGEATGEVVAKPKRARKPVVKSEGDGDKPPRPKLNREAVITLLTEANPKRGKSAERFAAYATGQTVAQALAAGVTTSDIYWDVGRGYISLS